MNIKVLEKWFFGLIWLMLLVPFVASGQFIYPLVVTKALLLRGLALLILPIYGYLVIRVKAYRPSWRNPLTAALLGFFVINLLTSFTGVNIDRSLWGNFERMGGTYYLGTLALLYFYVLLLAKINSRWLQWLLKSWVWVGAVTGTYALWEKLGLPLLFPDPSLPERASSTFGNPIFFASFLVLPLALACFFALQEEARSAKLRYWLLAALQLLGIYLSVTRGAAVGLAVGAGVAGVVYIALSSKTRSRRIGVAAIAALILLAGLFFAVRGKLPEQSLARRLTEFHDSNTVSRLIQWRMAWEGIQVRPLLGVGPENYYYIANKYFDPQLYNYDYSWFDKPHNYWLELWATTGLFGLLSYLAVAALSIWATLRARRAGILSGPESAALIGGLVAYQVQNLFVFDTISAAIIFFIFTAFCGYLYEEAAAAPLPAKDRAKSAGWAWTLGLGYLAIAYLVYASVWQPAKISRDINYGMTVGNTDPVKAQSYFEAAAAEPFDFDPGELGVKYQTMAIKAALDFKDQIGQDAANRVLDGATAVLRQVTERITTNPVYWFDLENLYAVKADLNKTPVDPGAAPALDRAVALAPSRIEPKFFQVQLAAVEGHKDQVIALSEAIVREVPENAEAKWRLALAYEDAGRKQDAVTLAEQALAQGYKPKLVQEIKWLINYYVDRQNFPKLVEMFQQAVKLSPGDSQLWASLAAAYAKVGDKPNAIAAAHKVQQLNPAAAAEVEQFLRQLEGSGGQ
ncbi:MAG: O-antigen ligase family protein [Patescibacteria group bacterium]|nr:O-antigen ligase family protein [Patescibacteria group bacterium]